MAVETCSGFTLASSLSVASDVAGYATVCDAEAESRIQTSFLVDIESGDTSHAIRGSFGQEQPLSPDATRFVRAEWEPSTLQFQPPAIRDTATGEIVVELQGVCPWDGSQETQLAAATDEDSCFLGDGPPFASALTRFDWSPDETMVAAVDGRVDGSGALTAVWDSDSGEMLFYELGNTSLTHHVDAIFSPDSSALITSYWEPALRRFSTASWEMEKEVPLPLEMTGSSHTHFVGFDTDGSHLIAIIGIGRGEVSLHWLDSETLELDFSITNVHETGVRATAMSGDRRLIATAGADGMVRIWSSEDGTLVHEAALGESVIQGVGFVDESHVAVTPINGGLQVITTDIDELLAIVRNTLTRGFTDVECGKYNFEGGCPSLEELQAGD